MLGSDEKSFLETDYAKILLQLVGKTIEFKGLFGYKSRGRV